MQRPRPPNLNVQPLQPYIFHPTDTLFHLTSQIPNNWRSTLIASIPPNLSDWFIPQEAEGHWDIYRRPIFFENEGKWRFEYMTALACILRSFSGEFIRELKAVTGVVFGYGHEDEDEMLDLMKLIDYLETFIEEVRATFSPTPSPTPILSPRTQRPTLHPLIIPEYIPPLPRRNLRRVFQRLKPPTINLNTPISNSGPSIPRPRVDDYASIRTQATTRSPTNIRLPDRHDGSLTFESRRDSRSSDSGSGSEIFSRPLSYWIRRQHSNTEEENSRDRERRKKALLKAGVEPDNTSRIADEHEYVTRHDTSRETVERRIAYSRREEMEARKLVPRLTRAYTALRKSPGAVMRKCAGYTNEASRVIINSPRNIIKKCAKILESRRDQQLPVPVPLPPHRSLPDAPESVTEPNESQSSASSNTQTRIRNWYKEIRTQIGPMTRLRAPPSFEAEYPYTGLGRDNAERNGHHKEPPPAQPGIMVEPDSVPPESPYRPPPQQLPRPGPIQHLPPAGRPPHDSAERILNESGFPV